MRPKYIFMENVKGFETSETRNAFIEMLKACGYTYQVSGVVKYVRTRQKCYVMALKYKANLKNNLVGGHPTVCLQKMAIWNCEEMKNIFLQFFHA